MELCNTQSSTAQLQQSSAADDSGVVLFDRTKEDSEIVRLKKENRFLRMVLRNAVQCHFSTDFNSIALAIKFYREEKMIPPGVPITLQMVIGYWAEHGGPEGFARDFGTEEDLRIKELLRALHGEESQRIQVEFARL